MEIAPTPEGLASRTTRITRSNHRRLIASAAILSCAVAGAMFPQAAQAQMPDGLPFYAGERLTYRLQLSKVGKSGTAVMSMDGPVEVRGVAVYALRFDIRMGMGPIKGADHTKSWIDLDRMASMRFWKEERTPFVRRDESVELFLDRMRWEAADGTSGEIASTAPLDELSFMYFIRTLRLAPDTVYQFNRHFDVRRNPTTVRVVRRDTITTGAGRFPAILVEMKVRDARRYDGDGIIRIYLSDDDLRLPLRIESTMPVFGTAVLSLESHTSQHAHVVTSERTAPLAPRRP